MPNDCFFPDHRQLREEICPKVVRYAHRRLDKVPLNVPTDMTLLTHSVVELDVLLGEGSFSSVFSVKHLDTTIKTLPPATEVVVKVLRKKLVKNPPMMAACAADLVKEGILLARLSHHHIVKVHAWAPNGVDAFGQGRHDAFFLVLGKLQTTLAKKLTTWRHQQLSKTRSWSIFRSRKILDEKLQCFEERLQIVDQLLEAVAYLHSQHVLHRDLKPDNIGFDSNGVLKVFDFDVARMLPTKDTSSTTTTTTTTTFQMTKRVGSPRYAMSISPLFGMFSCFSNFCEYP